jgi:hypothetical protein
VIRMRSTRDSPATSEETREVLRRLSSTPLLKISLVRNATEPGEKPGSLAKPRSKASRSAIGHPSPEGGEGGQPWFHGAKGFGSRFCFPRNIPRSVSTCVFACAVKGVGGYILKILR